MIKSIVLVGGGFLIGVIVGLLVPKALARFSRKGFYTILSLVDAPMLVFLGLLVAFWVYGFASGDVHIPSVLATLFLLTVAVVFAVGVLLAARWEQASRAD